MCWKKSFHAIKERQTLKKIQKVIGANLDMTEERVGKDNFFFFVMSFSHINQTKNLMYLKQPKKKKRGAELGKQKGGVCAQKREKMGESYSDPFCRRNILCACNNRGRASIDMVVKLEWMAMEYAVLWQVLFCSSFRERSHTKKCRKAYA